MDYEQYIINSYSIQRSELQSDSFIFFKSNGEFVIDNDTGFDNAYDNLEGLFYFGANYYNRFLQEGSYNLVSFAYCFNSKDILFCNTTRLEYLVLGTSGSTGGVRGYQYNVGDALDELSSIDNYWNSHGNNPFSDFLDEGTLYGSYNIDLTGSAGYCVFDYLNLKYDNLNDSFSVIRGENMSFYNVVTELAITGEPNNIYFAYGAPTLSRYKEGEQAGYRNGYAEGWTNGNQNGYQVGINSQGGSITQPPATAFTYIEGAFNVVGSVMSLEVLPNITLGLVWSIPLVFVLIMTIFKLVRK